jgi:hypothetical protein
MKRKPLGWWGQQQVEDVERTRENGGRGRD